MCQTSRLVRCTELHFLSDTNIPVLKTYSLLRDPTKSLHCDVTEIMLCATNEERGTVAGLAALSQALDEELTDGK
jgi:hypothetical protein